MSNSSANSMQFGFGKPNTNDNKQTEGQTTMPVEETRVASTASDSIDVETKEDLDAEYTDERSITIALVENYSLYRRANERTLAKRRDHIGSSVSASRILSANKKEIETYFPTLLGYPANHENFIPRLKQYLNNIRIHVDELGRTFNTSFVYNHKRDFIRIKAQEDKIEADYQKANRQDLNALKEALQDKITKLNALESSKCSYGYPVNLEDYLMYRHCLLYKDVAKDTALINSDKSIRFYFKDNQKEARKLEKHRLEVNKAKANFVACLTDDSLFDAIYMQYCIINNLPVIYSLSEPRIDREIKLDKFSTDDPVKFNRIFNNKDIKLIATIEMLIARGELIRYRDNQNIMSTDGTLIGANMGEAVAWFKNPNNTSVVNAYYNKLKNI